MNSHKIDCNSKNYILIIRRIDRESAMQITGSRFWGVRPSMDQGQKIHFCLCYTNRVLILLIWGFESPSRTDIVINKQHTST